MNLNAEKLKELAKSCMTSNAVFSELAARLRWRQTTDMRMLRRAILKKGVRVNDTDYTNTFRQLEKLGIGKILKGYHGHSDKFQWQYSLKDVAKIGLEGKSSPAKELGIVQTPIGPKLDVVRRKPAADDTHITIRIPKELLKYIKAVTS